LVFWNPAHDGIGRSVVAQKYCSPEEESLLLFCFNRDLLKITILLQILDLAIFFDTLFLMQQ
jgi:hypothetical protein